MRLHWSAVQAFTITIGLVALVSVGASPANAAVTCEYRTCITVRGADAYVDTIEIAIDPCDWNDRVMWADEYYRVHAWAPDYDHETESRIHRYESYPVIPRCTSKHILHFSVPVRRQFENGTRLCAEGRRTGEGESPMIFTPIGRPCVTISPRT